MAGLVQDLVLKNQQQLGTLMGYSRVTGNVVGKLPMGNEVQVKKLRGIVQVSPLRFEQPLSGKTDRAPRGVLKDGHRFSLTELEDGHPILFGTHGFPAVGQGVAAFRKPGHEQGMQFLAKWFKPAPSFEWNGAPIGN